MTLPTDSTTNAGVAGAPYPCSLGGRPYMLDLSKGNFVERTIPLLRNQADTGGLLAEQSLNPEDLVRRSAESWHLGKGQTYRDRDRSDPARYRWSVGVDPFEQWELRLLNECTLVEATAATTGSNPAPHTRLMTNFGNRIYAVDGTQTIRTAAGTPSSAVWATVTGTPAADFTDMTSDGWTNYFAFEQVAGTSSIYTGTGTSVTQLLTLAGADIRAVGWVKGRLMVGDSAGRLYNPTDFTTPPNALPTALMTLSGTLAEWVGFAEGPNHIYAAAYTGPGARGTVFKTAVKPDGTALDVPTVAATLPTGEKLVGIGSYLNYVLLGVVFTDTRAYNPSRLGVRFCQIEGDGSLNMGPVIDIGRDNSSSDELWGMFDAMGPFVLATAGSMNDTDATRDGIAEQGGLARLDLRSFVLDGAPAATFDSCVAATLPWCSGVAYWSGHRAFLIDGTGVYVESTAGIGAGNLIAVGVIHLGRMTYGVVDSKVAMYLDLLLDAEDGGGSVTVWISADGGAYTSYGTVNSSDTQPATVDLSALTASEFEVRLHLTRDGSDAKLGPIVRRATLRAFVNASRTREFILPLIIRPRVTQNAGGNTYLDARAEIDAIAAMVGTVVVMKLGTNTEYVQIKDYQWDVDYLDEESGQFGGICMVKCQAVA